MRIIAVGTLACILITVPVILQSCCGGISGGDDVYYNIDSMSMSVHAGGNGATPSPAKLSELSFLLSFQVTRAEIQSIHGSALYACSELPMISNQKITAIAITSNKDLILTSGTITAGESLNFKFMANSVGHIGDPVSDLINSPLLDDYVVFRSDAALTTAQTHTFIFKITLDDGRDFKLETESLDLLKG